MSDRFAVDCGARVPPHDLQAEEAVLGAMLLSAKAIAASVAVLSGPDAFYRPAHGHIYDAVTRLNTAGVSADPVTVADVLRRVGLLEDIGGKAVLVNLQAGTPAISNAGRYALIVEEHALLRRLIRVAADIADLAYSLPSDVPAVIEQAASMLSDLCAVAAGA